MKVTLARYNNDRYIIIEEGGKTVTYKAKMLMKTSEITYTGIQDISYESEFFEATFLKEEYNKNKQKENSECEPVDISSLFKKEEVNE